MRALGIPETTDLRETNVRERLSQGDDYLVSQLSDLVRRMRQACTHPHVVVQSNLGALWRLQLGNIEDVLALMIEQGHNEQINARLSLFQRKITRATLHLQNVQDPHRLTEAQGLLGDVADALEEAIEHLVHAVNEAELSGPLYCFTPKSLEQALRIRKANRLATKEGDEHSDQPLQGEELDGENSTGDQLKARAHQLATTRDRVVRYREQLHRAYQFLGHTYFQLGEQWQAKQNSSLQTDNGPSKAQNGCLSGSDKSPASALIAVNPFKVDEDRMYQQAEQIRRLLLKDATDLIGKALSTFVQDRMDADHTISSQPPVPWIIPEANDQAGLPLLGGSLVTAYRRLIRLLNEHTRTMFRWRMQIFEHVKHPVNREVDAEKADDDQYAENLDRQSESEVYLEMYRVLLAEREFILTGMEVVEGRALPHLYRQLEAKVRTERRAMLLGQQEEKGEEDPSLEAAKQQLQIFRRLIEELDGVKLPSTSKPLRDILAEIRGLSDRILSASDQKIVSQVQDHARSVLTRHTQLVGKAKRDATELMAVYNARSSYFKGIQQLSDSVADVEVKDIPSAIQDHKRKEGKAAHELGALAGRVRYLENLHANQFGSEAETHKPQAPDCIICTERITTGVLLQVCGHLVCETCFQTWSQRHWTCPVCRAKLPHKTGDSVHRVTYQMNDPAKKNTPGSYGTDPIDHTSLSMGLVRSNTTSLPGVDTPVVHGGRQLNLDEMDVVEVRERSDILETPAMGGHQGSKVDMLIRHLRYITQHSQDKALVFSDFSRGLDVVASALDMNGIPYVRSDGTQQRHSRHHRHGRPFPAHRGSSAPRLRAGGIRNCAAIFRTDPEIRIFLLHADSQASGLNLLAARHVFLLAPLLNQGLELQAIGRVHRIGQTQPTQVWGYFVLDSVEETLLHLKAQRGTSVFTKKRPPGRIDGERKEDRSLEEVGNAVEAERGISPELNSIAMPLTSHRRGDAGDLVLSRDDSLACLFRPLPRAS